MDFGAYQPIKKIKNKKMIFSVIYELMVKLLVLRISLQHCPNLNAVVPRHTNKISVHTLEAVFSPGGFLLESMSTPGEKRLVRPGGDTPPKKKGKTKHPNLEDGACVQCSKQLKKDEDTLECVWCDGVEHRESGPHRI